MREAVIGQYYPAESVIHRLDARVKLAGTMIYIISLFLFKSFSCYLVVAAFLLTVIILSKVPLGYILRGLRTVIFLLIFMSMFNLFFTPGDIVYWKAGPFQMTNMGVRNACFMALRLSLLIIGSSMMTFTTTPNQLTDGLESLLKPLRKIGLPVHEIAMMMSIALRFIPILMEETQKIMKAQMARGASFDEGNLIQKAKSLVPILVPLFVSAFRRADDLAMAMEARCYHGGDGRTKMKPLRYRGRDYAAYAILAVYVALVIVIGKVWYL
ncbi:MAG: energy-coupling factor transporter transmembrane protein EcfT [Lachnospiraceae bacterium]|nr:energy-coupling factor transporter transmembrane protein EcfT [Lachnospiraceae bacterium]MBQ9594050.1 energy-coupling factor transporter transmembrane protein EcfT [Lachnospiraceae bacterium]MBR0153780.1 energy-coupling factor transporter transmembrane protein EcfT [Lachnospiraceae bacterium]